MGVLRITQALLNDFDLKVNHKRVYRLMKELEIQGRGYRKRTRKYDSSKGPEGIRVTVCKIKLEI
ncbi:IS3 family transposase [Lentilactobacillus kefiri]|uniref:IS3 family transposase n=1 Tax=Lentilactobacillus kefiri TaxID=33962 RepID=UPI0035CF3BBE